MSVNRPKGKPEIDILHTKWYSNLCFRKQYSRWASSSKNRRPFIKPPINLFIATLWSGKLMAKTYWKTIKVHTTKIMSVDLIFYMSPKRYGMEQEKKLIECTCFRRTNAFLIKHLISRRLDRKAHTIYSDFNGHFKTSQHKQTKLLPFSWKWKKQQ